MVSWVDLVGLVGVGACDAGHPDWIVQNGTFFAVLISYPDYLHSALISHSTYNTGTKTYRNSCDLCDRCCDRL
jgi:hypothetical protein